MSLDKKIEEAATEAIVRILMEDKEAQKEIFSHAVSDVLQKTMSSDSYHIKHAVQAAVSQIATKVALDELKKDDAMATIRAGVQKTLDDALPKIIEDSLKKALRGGIF